MAVDRNDLIDIVGKLRDRANILRMVSYSFAAVGGKDTADSLGLLAEDMRLDLAALLDGLQNLEGAA